MRNFVVLALIGISLSTAALARSRDVDCSEFRSESARRECREHKYDRDHRRDDNEWRRDDEQRYKRKSTSYEEAKRLCGQAHTSADHEVCMKNLGY
ncbi:hypothetical protein HZU75_08460 [Chitinibacter fontanus]|uniref:Uncharacterized protein n=1 Tax=Chitinibacter fontanus TaxID=1737446 RepID=A0A7D5V9P5_9NEIS|nr:hypothetical protein [Chitinibacter fontanus]QLI81559.1 hypothetical protein HZU75_08460 [Chitinibacter fontanus]